MQTDLIGYGDGLNWYNYTHSDPVNSRDSAGTDCSDGVSQDCEGQIVVTGGSPGSSGFSGGGSNGPSGEIVVNGAKPATELPPDGTIPYNGQPCGSCTVWNIDTGAITVTGTRTGSGNFINLRWPQSRQDTPASHCLGVAALKNARAFAFDVAGAVASALPGERAAVALGGLALGAAGLTNSAISADTNRPGISLSGFAIGIAGFHVTSAGPLAKAFEATSEIAANLPLIGGGLVALQTGVDVYNTYLDYQECRSGK